MTTTLTMPRVAVTLCLATRLLAGADIPPVQKASAALDPGLYGTVEAFLRRGDADGNRQLGPAELVAVEGQVKGQHGERGVLILRQFAAAADADADGSVSVAEWEALGERIGTRVGVSRETAMVPMQDGVTLATEVWRPASGGPYPVILQRTPYGRARNDEPPAAVRQAYVVVVQDMRGRFGSEGENLPFVGCGWQKHQDGFDTVRWLLKQPWCNGKIATQGGSAGGITQNLLAGTAPEGLVCQHITVAAASLYHHAAYVGGALRQCQVEGWLTEHQFSPEALLLYRAHPTYDEFWHAFDSTRKHAEMTVPAMHVGGWFDTFSLGTVTSFTGRQNEGGPGARGTQKLVLGPWAHGGFKDGGKVGELTFPNAKAPAEYGAGRWLEHYLKGAANGVDKLKPVAYFVMGDVDAVGAPGNEWRYADTWPPTHTQITFYLTPDRRLVAPVPSTTGVETAIAYSFDPTKPCPTRGGGNLTIPSGPMDQRPIEGRPDVLCFSTDPLSEPLEVSGQIRATLFLSSDAVDTDLSVRFCDVYPDGRSLLMAEGMLRVRYREGFTTPVPMVPGTIYPVNIDLWPTSLALNTGHRARLTITSSNHPRFDVNPGTGKPWGEGEPLRTQRNRIHCSADYPSQLVLPVPVAPRPG